MLSAGAVISVFSVTLVTIYGQTRILYTISRDGLIPKIFHRVNARTRTPIANTLIVGAGVALVAGLVDSNFLWDMVSMGTLTAFIVVSIAVPVHAPQGPRASRPRRRLPRAVRALRGAGAEHRFAACTS